MGGILGLSLLTAYYASICIIPNPDSVITEFFVVYQFWYIALTFITFGFTIVQYEYIYFLLTVVMFSDMGINYGLQQLFGSSDNFQPPTCFVNLNQMPSRTSELIIVLYVIGWSLVTYIYPRGVEVSKIWMFNIAAALAIYDSLYLLFSTPKQMLVGAGVGFAEGIFFSIIFLWMKHKKYDRVLIDSPGFCLFPPLSDTLAYPCTPTYVSKNKPEQVYIKSSDSDIYTIV